MSDDEQKSQQPTTLQRVLPGLESYRDTKPAKVTDYGGGKWFWQKTWEVNNPEDPMEALSVSAEYLLDRMTGLVSVKRSWILRASLPYLVRLCLGKIKRSCISYVLEELDSQGFIERLPTGTNKRTAQYFLINPTMMALERAQAFAHYEVAARMTIVLKPKVEKKKATKMCNGVPLAKWNAMSEKQKRKILLKVAAKAKAGAAIRSENQVPF